ncbi:MAG: hypothetical protein A3G49_01305 [Candidatus Sungbacteria bacterium RIFCSPLOWO2_12_FULL_41_11]|uniref:30S ribosomal protein S21 n=1 Tax=Candidatus Sungbacteria bacterium RIFCSPLOWO2_12_FULL_41_11 TaxID=1802286 RepID=A0A1G2LR39_9BACT|nr:MAG: hypothetical protein A3D41_05485 [Candidatus Sungbacteria bacterium RIFCSPHIGHO2_02_FULL_41_12b]OHA13271.1 MAG: hypothetical protein A3G49_01305 [Candidatus Sungbacteria bacterium RIFCSPLOWO2_12_FULL_41_11]
MLHVTNLVYVIKKDKETSSAMLRRFTRIIQQSGVLLQARKMKSYKRPLNKRARKVGALRRLKARKERERLVKLGKMKERVY